MSLINITPEPIFSEEYGDYSETHYYGEGCDIANCDSPVSSYLVLLDGKEMSICEYDFETLKENN